MDITQLRYFLVTADTLNYTKAAERLFMSRQALRQALTVMEEELGAPLFINEKNKLSLTVQGEYLQLSAQPVVEAFETMLIDVKQFSQGRTALKIALSVSLFPFLVPEMDEILKKFQQKYPQIQVDCDLMTNDEVIDAVMSGTVDFGGLVQMKCKRTGVVTQPLAEYGAVMSVGPAHRELEHRKLSVEDLVGYSCIGMGSLAKSMKPLYEDCVRKGITLQHEIVPDPIDAFYRITHGDLVGFDIDMGEGPTIGKLFKCPLEDYTWQIGMFYPQEHLERKEVQLFYRFAEEEHRRIQMRKEG